MFGKYQAVFRSRYRALIWASGVLLTAYCTVPSADEGDDPLDPAAQQALASLVKPQPHAPSGKHANPWALKDESGAGR